MTLPSLPSFFLADFSVMVVKQLIAHTNHSKAVGLFFPPSPSGCFVIEWVTGLSVCLTAFTVVLLPSDRCDSHFFPMIGKSHYMIGWSHDMHLFQVLQKECVRKKEVILVFILCRAPVRFDQASKQYKGLNHFANKSAIGTLKPVSVSIDWGSCCARPQDWRWKGNLRGKTPYEGQKRD